MTPREEKAITELNDLYIRMERIHSIAAALASMLEDEPRTRRDYATLALIIRDESETH